MSRKSTDATSREVLVKALRNDNSVEVRAEVALSLALTGTDNADDDLITDALFETAKNDSEGLGPAAVLVLGDRQDASTVERLVELLVSAPELWHAIASALGRSEAVGIVPRLEHILETADDPRTRRGAARALGLRWSAERSCRRLGSSRPAVPTDHFQTDSELEDRLLFGYEDHEGNLHPCA